MFFKKKKTEDNIFKRINEQHVAYVTSRNTEDGSQVIIAREGHINIVGDEIVLHCGNEDIYRQKMSTAKVWELMSKNGAVFECVSCEGCEPREGCDPCEKCSPHKGHTLYAYYTGD